MMRRIKCTSSCINKFQDKKYGRGMRTHNQTPKGWTCTVCGNRIEK